MGWSHCLSFCVPAPLPLEASSCCPPTPAALRRSPRQKERARRLPSAPLGTSQGLLATGAGGRAGLHNGGLHSAGTAAPARPATALCSSDLALSGFSRSRSGVSVPRLPLSPAVSPARSTLGLLHSGDGLLAEAEARSLRANEALLPARLRQSLAGLFPQLGFCVTLQWGAEVYKIQTSLVPGQTATRGTAPSYGSSLSQLSEEATHCAPFCILPTVRKSSSSSELLPPLVISCHFEDSRSHRWRGDTSL